MAGWLKPLVGIALLGGASYAGYKFYETKKAQALTKRPTVPSLPPSRAVPAPKVPPSDPNTLAPITITGVATQAQPDPNSGAPAADVANQQATQAQLQADSDTIANALGAAFPSIPST